MEQLSGNQIRQKFIDYFVAQGHIHIPTSSLVPFDDPTLLFTNAGMVQFKDVFLGLDKRDYKRAVTSQLCLRAGGKHNDLDTVGRTARHHTLFEMLGNFSFGDYFKDEAIRFAWQFLTETLAMPIDKLYVTVFEEDDQAEDLWLKNTPLTKERIFRIGAKDNFWSMGDTGPCGPCSEIFFDRGPEYGCDAPICGIGHCDCDRWMEIWNLVFMQYDRDQAGVLSPLPNPSIDTGMGLERVASIMQQKDSNYDCDMMQGIIKGIEELSGKKYSSDAGGFPFRVIADHIRACSFLIADGITPSNEGRGYVLRRILRRAARFGRVLGFEKPFLYQIFPYLKQSLGFAYPKLISEEEAIIHAIHLEEDRFHLTLADGMKVAATMIKKAKDEQHNQLNGEDLFRLYDTYGFPLDLAKDIAEEQGLSIDEAGFTQAMQKQKDRARAARSNSGDGQDTLRIGQLLADYQATEFCGYQQLQASAQVQAIIKDNNLVDQAISDDIYYLVFDKTPFYAESGGQIGDRGLISNDTAKAQVLDTQKMAGGVFIHKIKLISGTITINQQLDLAVDANLRQNTARNHSATHILHQALRHALGNHVHQAGSLVNDQRLRFDFNNDQPLSGEQISIIENEVNQIIMANLPLTSEIMSLDAAKAKGAMAFFGDKYGDTVRVIAFGDYSLELCGGCHVTNSSEIGLLKIVSEAGIGSGMRRIEALTGPQALAYYQEREQQALNMANLLKSNIDDALKRLENLLAENKSLQKELAKEKAAKAKDGLGDIITQAEEIAGIKIVAAEIGSGDINELRNTLDMLRDKLGEAVIVLASGGEKVQFVVAVSAKAQALGLHAGQLIKQVASVCGGGGGGKPDMAQAGAKDSSKIGEALQLAITLIKEKINI